MVRWALWALQAGAGLGIATTWLTSCGGAVELRVEGDPSTCVNLDALVAPVILGGFDSAARAALASALEETQPLPCSPTLDALNAGYQSLRGDAPDPVLLLITDDFPSLAGDCLGECSGTKGTLNQPVLLRIAEAADQGIRTYVLGIPDYPSDVDPTSREPFLSRAARLGLTAWD